MKSLLVGSLLVSLTVAGSLPPYGAGGVSSGDPYAVGGSSGGGYDGDGGDYGEGKSYAQETKCTPYYDTTYEDKCIAYNERVCTTHQQEACHDVPGENCRALVTSKQVRKCFDVTELLCSLKEDVQYEVIQATYTVQKCQRVTERVCDTVYETQYTNKDDYKCLSVSNLQCFPEEKTIHEKTCKTIVNFDCKQAFTSSAGPVEFTTTGGGGGDSYGSDSYGSSDAYGSSSSSASESSFGASEGFSEPVCSKRTEVKCYNTPRQVSIEKCDVRPDKACEKLSERVPFPTEKQHCHNEEKKVCELEQRTQPKQVKKYTYTKQCRPMPRKICENMDVKDLVQSCAPHQHKNCNFTPIEKCVDVPKEHCYKVARKIQKQKCETVAKYGGDSYETQTAY
jgi:hypothetical protein